MYVIVIIMSSIETILIINVLIALSCHAYLFPLFGTGQHAYPRSFLLHQKLQALLVTGVSILLFNWMGIIIGIVLALWSATIFMPIQIILHLIHGINIATQPIPTIKFPWDTLTNSINFIWTLSLISLIIFLVLNFLG